MKKCVLAVVLVLVMAIPAMAKINIQLPDTLTQDDFKALSTDLGMALSYQPLSPAAPLGDKLPGFDAGVEASFVKLDTSARYFTEINKVANIPDTLVFPRVHVQVGLPIIPIDLGVSYTKAGDIKLTGFELKYAILRGGVAMPAIAIRGAYTKLSGIDDLDLSTKSLDLSISKGILIFTPYVGVGEVWITSDPHPTVTITPPLEKEDITKTKAFVGLKTKIFPFVNLVLEGDFSTVKEYSARLNLSF